jgi:hypothetical protein
VVRLVVEDVGERLRVMVRVSVVVVVVAHKHVRAAIRAALVCADVKNGRCLALVTTVGRANLQML